MVVTACRKCGTLNPTDAASCLGCGASTARPATAGVWRSAFLAHPVLSVAFVLLPLGGLMLGTGMWVRTPPRPASSRPAQSSEGPGASGERFGWQWCQGASGSQPSKEAPAETGEVHTARRGLLNIEWFWCRSSEGRLVVHAQVTNTGDEPIHLALLDFSLYDRTGSFIGNHSVTLRKVDPRGTAKIAEELPSQFSEWKWTPSSMRLASVDAN